MSELVNLFEEILNENPNQAIKFLKDKNLDPTVNPKGKEILDAITGFTKGDGYTALLTKFHIDENLNFEYLQSLYQRLKDNKSDLNRLPIPVVNYKSSIELVNDLYNLGYQKVIRKLYKSLSPLLQRQMDNLKSNDGLWTALRNVAIEFFKLSTEHQRQFMKKAFSYKSLATFSVSLRNYVEAVKGGIDYDSIKSKINATENAFLIYDNPKKGIIIAHIYSFDAANELGCTTAWCIAKDIERFKEYKEYNNYYFYIWDYNYPIDDPNFFIATAYNLTNPESSKTHEHTDDGILNLSVVLNEKKLDFRIFQNYLFEFKKTEQSLHKSQGGLAQALRNKNIDQILEIIDNSAIAEQYRMKPYETRLSYEKEIDLRISKKAMIDMLNLGDQFESISYAAEGVDSGSWDSQEAEYMNHGLNNENLNITINVAKMLGVSAKEYSSFKDTEGAISSFLENYGMSSVVENYLSDYSDAQAEAEHQAARALVDQIPFDVLGGKFEINAMKEYYDKNNLTADNFDELIEEIKTKLPEFSWEELAEARYTEADLSRLNENFKDKMEAIITDIETDNENPYYERAHIMRESINYLEKLGFKITNNAEDEIARLGLPNMSITVTSLESKPIDDDNYTIIVYATIEYNKFYYQKKKTPLPHTKKVKVPLTSLRNYIYQYQLPFKELKEQIYKVIFNIN